MVNRHMRVVLGALAFLLCYAMGSFKNFRKWFFRAMPVLSLVTLYVLGWVVHPRQMLRQVLSSWKKYQNVFKAVVFTLACFAVGALGKFAPEWQVLILEVVREWIYKGFNNLPGALMDGFVLYLVTYGIHWVREELKKEDPVAQLFAGRMNTSLNLVLPGGGFGIRTLSEDSVADYFNSDEAQQTILGQAEAMDRGTPCYPYISLPGKEKKAFCDHVINKVSSMFAMTHVLADGCRRGDYVDEEFTFGLSFEVPPDGNPNLIQQKFRLYIIRSSDLEQTALTECNSPMNYFKGRWENLQTLLKIANEEKATAQAKKEVKAEGKEPPPNFDELIPVWGKLKIPIPRTAYAQEEPNSPKRTGTVPTQLTLTKSRAALKFPDEPTPSPQSAGSKVSFLESALAAAEAESAVASASEAPSSPDADVVAALLERQAQVMQEQSDRMRHLEEMVTRIAEASLPNSTHHILST